MIKSQIKHAIDSKDPDTALKLLTTAKIGDDFLNPDIDMDLLESQALQLICYNLKDDLENATKFADLVISNYYKSAVPMSIRRFGIFPALYDFVYKKGFSDPSSKVYKDFIIQNAKGFHKRLAIKTLISDNIDALDELLAKAKIGECVFTEIELLVHLIDELSPIKARKYADPLISLDPTQNKLGISPLNSLLNLITRSVNINLSFFDPSFDPYKEYIRKYDYDNTVARLEIFQALYSTQEDLMKGKNPDISILLAQENALKKLVLSRDHARLISSFKSMIKDLQEKK
jgi:hypothetical protein